MRTITKKRKALHIRDNDFSPLKISIVIVLLLAFLGSSIFIMVSNF